jgi:ABC-type enterochelin transport system permease subunit
MTRLAGAAMLGFTIMVFSVFYFKVEAIYDVVIFVRLPVMAVVTWLYIDTHDPLFLILLITVLPGVVFSSIAKSIDKKRQIKIQN